MTVYRFKLNGTEICSMALESCRLALRAGGPDRLEWSRAAGATETPPAVHDAAALVCETLTDGELTATETLFSGRVVSVSGRDTAADTGYRVIAENAWGDLRRITLTQSWASWDPAEEEVVTQTSSRVVVGMSDEGLYQHTGEAIGDILDAAIAAGAILTKGTLDPALYVPPTEVVDTSCDAALRQVLAYHPDMVAWVAGQTLHVRAPSALASTAIDPDCDGLDFDHAALTDEIPGGVAIIWERTHDTDGRTRIERIPQTAGPMSGWPPPLYMTIPLAGTSITSKEQVIETRTIPDPEDLDATLAKAFYKGLIPAIAAADNADLAIRGQTIDWADPKVDELDDEEEETVNPNSRPIDRGEDDVDDFPRMLVNGEVQPWMPGSLKQYDAILRATIYYRGSDETVKKYVGQKLEIAEPIIITNALPKTYRVVDEIEAAEEPIAGLATSYWNAINQARNEGNISGPLAGQWLVLRPGVRCTITGRFSDAAVIRETEIDVIAQTFRAAYGTGEYLNPKTIADLARAMAKNRPSWRRPKERTEAEADGAVGPVKEGAKTAPMYAAPSATPAGLWDLEITTGETTTVSIARPGTILPDLSDLSAALTIASIGSTFTPAAGDYLVLKIEDLSDLTATLVKESEWTDHPSAYEITDSGADAEFSAYRYPLWEFVDTAAADTIPVTDSVHARRIGASVNFSIGYAVYQLGDDRPVTVPVLHQYHRAIS